MNSNFLWLFLPAFVIATPFYFCFGKKKQMFFSHIKLVSFWRHYSSISSFDLIDLFTKHLTISLPVPRWAGDNTVLLTNSNISKAVRINIAFTECFLKSIR